MKRVMLTVCSFFLFVVFTTFLFPAFSWAAAHYIRQGASGTACSDWGANACNALPSTLVRGDIYYIAGGSYSGRTFSTPESGTALITIKGATIADHGTDVGWSDGYSVQNTQAKWTSGLTFASSYWVFDGSVGSMTKTPTAYGFAFNQLSGVVQIGNTVGPSYTDFTFSHIYAKATANDVEKLFLQNAYQVGAINNVTVSHSLLDGWQNGMMARGQGGAACNNWVFEYNMALNGSSTPTNHGEWINSNSAPLSNAVVRFNYFEGYSGGGQTGVIVANNCSNNGAKIYGNVFNGVVVGNGIITGTSVATLNNAQVYNNTFVNCSVATDTPLNGPGSGNVAYNNLFYNMPAGISNFTHDYNYFISANGPSESHSQTGSSNPFVNLSGGDFRLLDSTQTGMTLSSPYNVDMDGNIRGADGIWDRGAYQFVAQGTAKKPMPPTLLRVN